MTSSWFFLSTLNYDARSATHQITVNHTSTTHLWCSCSPSHFPDKVPISVQATGIHCNKFYNFPIPIPTKNVFPLSRHNFIGKQIVFVFVITDYVLRPITNAISRLNNYKDIKEFINFMSHIQYM